MSVSILIVNWNSKDMLRECLRSIRDTCADLVSQIVVVDGGSYDGCGEMLASEFKDVEFVQSKHNVGFGRANNIGLARITGEVVWVLNPDTEVLPGVAEAEGRSHAFNSVVAEDGAGLFGIPTIKLDIVRDTYRWNSPSDITFVSADAALKLTAASALEGKPERVVQINFQLFPLSKRGG